MACVPVSVSVTRRSWGKLLAPREAAGRPKRSSSAGVSGQVDRGAVQADQPAAAVPGARRAGLGQRAGHAREQLPERVGAEPGPGSGDGGLAGQARVRAGRAQPAQALQQAAQDLAVGGLGIEGQRDDVVDHQAGRQLTLPLAPAAGVGEHGIDQGGRHRGRQDPQGDVIAEPRAVRQTRRLAGHRLFPRERRSPRFQQPNGLKSTVLGLAWIIHEAWRREAPGGSSGRDRHRRRSPYGEPW